ncbi:hypothetical protein GCM10008967_04470 [Bacillus carboniphilus]|uniref:Uncharacterized protein n=1 Tax=Bacillus carboniphilus TaxID=86663 RepID=A0ABN0VTP0_9BACI
MNFLKRSIGILGMVIMLIMAVSCSKEENVSMEESTMNKDIKQVTFYDSKIPNDYKLIDWRKKALQYDELVFDTGTEGTFLPLMWEDTTYDSFGLPAYVGDGRMHKDGAQEAVTNVAAVLSATLMGIDKSTVDTVDYVSQLDAFFSEEEQIILNNPAGSSETTSMWYLLYPAILYSHVSYLYDDHEEMREKVLANIESWYGAYEVMYNNGEPNFDYTGFNFITGEPYRNGVWSEPDSAVGIGLLMYYGYEMTGDEKYLEASINTMEYIEGYFGSPLYEALMYFGPYLAAKLNALHGTDFEVADFLNDTIGSTAIPRGGWGSIVGQWGGYDMNGLFGSTTDGGGYAFAMNTFAAAGAIVPVAQYDARYAKSIGEWMLHLTSNSRYFYATETDEKNQSCTYVEACHGIDDRIKEAIPYEGIRKESQGRSPWFGGDPTVYGWAQTDFSLYSGSHTGILASIVEETNVEGILRLDVQATQFYNEHAFPTFLIYNPHNEVKEVEYEVASEGAVDLYNTLTNTVVASDVTGSVPLEVRGDAAVVIVEIPTGTKVEYREGNYYVQDTFISRDLASLNINGLNNNDTVSGKFEIKASLAANYEAEIETVTVEIDEEIFEFTGEEKIEFNTKDFSTGTKKIWVTVTTKDGQEDQNSIRLRFE